MDEPHGQQSSDSGAGAVDRAPADSAHAARPAPWAMGQLSRSISGSGIRTRDEATGGQDSRPAEETYPALGKKFRIRTAAWVIDLIVLYIVAQGIGPVVGFLLGLSLATLSRLMGLDFTFVGISQALTYLMGLLLSLAYTVSFESLHGATIGKLVLRMRVVKTDGTPCSLRAALVRGLYRLVDGFAFGAPAYRSMKRPPHQRLGDKAAHTLVVGSRDNIIRGARAWWWLIVAAVIYAWIAILIQALGVVLGLRLA